MSGKEALEHIKKVNYYEDDEEIIEDCYGIEKDLDIIEKDLDALEILKTKTPVIWDEIQKWEIYDEYYDYMCQYNGKLPIEKWLTKYEWELLKEIFG